MKGRFFGVVLSDEDSTTAIEMLNSYFHYSPSKGDIHGAITLINQSLIVVFICFIQ